jgi:hypothetical protein
MVAPEQKTPLIGVDNDSTAAQQQRQQEKLGSDPNFFVADDCRN